MRLGSGSTILSRTLLIAATPVFLLLAWLVVVVWPTEVIRGLVSVLSGRDVIQVADGKETDITLLLAILVLGALAWTLRLRPPERLAVTITVYGAVAAVPAIALLGIAAEYGLQRSCQRAATSIAPFMSPTPAREETAPMSMSGVRSQRVAPRCR